ncbi:MAG TPA: anhydro-N-acetylmuramic acid kinase [Chryseolinea sp.]|nr:anhydro-N-acetylmuramic acid kinase [Chryseolinea sp.]HPH46910.1 anhydro-N-acetylmuramic acid kinase [Chryseolinea sp.]HPM29353.1 anhydro-N-acetylmuramic acid kinase [Chryseolinea sp.]
MDSKEKYKVIGIMSGTSLDGVDLANCTFQKNEKGWMYKLDHTQTIKYPSAWKKRLATAHTLSAESVLILDAAYGKYLGEITSRFISENKIRSIDFISSHGHTLFHQPKKSLTFQAGNGMSIHAETNLPVIYNFRNLDVLLGGEGAPLVPVGDALLFSDYDVCLNLGGIANLSVDVKGKRVAYDISFCNMGLNYLMADVNKEFDRGGLLAASGEIDTVMLKALGKVYMNLRKDRPSLGREIFEKKIIPIMDRSKATLKDKLRTLVESAAIEIAFAIGSKNNPSVLCTGGGVFNSFLMTRLLEHCSDNATLIIPEDDVVKFKEALVFAFLGVLRVRDEVNCLKSVTHASRDNSGGVLVGF